MTSLIERLWLADNLPIRDGFYRRDGMACAVEVDVSIEGGLRVLVPFSVEEFIECHPDMVTSIDITQERPLPDGTGYLCCGEGSYGSEGFFGRLDLHKNLVWVVYLENSNPFVGVFISNADAVFTSSSGVMITTKLENSMFGDPGHR